ncbi:MAG: A circularly permuted ATPgrasp family protein, partial [Pseudomonadota bacterium]
MAQPDIRALAQACAATTGHFDELRALTTSSLTQFNSDATNLIADNALLTGALARFFEHLEDHGTLDLNQRALSLERQIRDNGVTYNVYADEGGPQRPWSLDLFPLIIEPDSWHQIEAGV